MVHNKYMNNFDYNNTVYLLKIIPFLQNGFLIVKEDASIPSPIAVVHYERYSNPDLLTHHLIEAKDQIQCIVTASDSFICKARIEKYMCEFWQSARSAVGRLCRWSRYNWFSFKDEKKNNRMFSGYFSSLHSNKFYCAIFQAEQDQLFGIQMKQSSPKRILLRKFPFVSQTHPDKYSFSNHMVSGNKSPESWISGIVSVVTHHKIVIHFKCVLSDFWTVHINFVVFFFQFVAFIFTDNFSKNQCYWYRFWSSHLFFGIQRGPKLSTFQPYLELKGKIKSW